MDAIGEVIQHDSKAVSTLKKVVDNIIRDPEEMKYRSLPLSNKLVIERILQVDGAVELLSSIGFTQQYIEGSDVEYFVLNDEDVDLPVLKYASEMLDRLSNQTTTSSSLASSSTTTNNSSTNASSDEEYNKRMAEAKARQEMIKKKLEEDAFRKELNKKRLMEQQTNLRDQRGYISASTLANNGFRTPGSRASNIKGYKDIGVDLNCRSG